MSYQAQQNTQWTSPYAVQNAPLPGSGGPSPMDQAVAGAPPGLIGGGSSSQQAQFSPQGLPAQNAPLPTAGAMAGEPPKEEKGFFGKLIGGVTSFVKGATVGLASSIVESFKDPKTWLLTAVGVIAIATGFGAPVGALLIGYGLTQTLPGLANSVGSAVKHYNNGETALAEKALEDAGTNAGAIGLSAVGIRGLVRTGGIPTRYTKRNGNEVGLKTRHNVVAQAASDIAYLTRYNMHQVGRVFNKEARAKGRENLTALRESLGTNGLLQTAKNGWRDSMSSAGTYMQQDRLSGHAGNVGRNGTTQLSRAQVADELVPALNGRGRIEVGGRRIERAAAEQHARENGYVPVAAERGKPVWMTRDEALQLHRDAVLAKDIPALYRRVDETKAALDNLKASHSEGVRLSWRESRQLSAAERAHQQANQAVSKAERSFARTTRSVNNEIFKPERIQAAEHARVASAAAATEAATPEGSATPAGITEAVTPDAPRISTGTTPARATTVNGMKQELSDLDSRIANAQPGQARNQLYGERNILLERIKAAEAQQSSVPVSGIHRFNEDGSFTPVSQNSRATTVNGMKQELSDLDSRIANAQPGQARNQLYGERNILLERIKAAEAQQSVASTAANAADGPSLRNNPQVRDNGLEVVETIPARGTRSDKGGTAAPYVGAGTGLALSGVAPRALPDALATYNPYANYARPPMFAPQAASDFRIFNYNDPNGLPMPQSNGSLSYSG